jgi:uncharacterized damage-inducible protein DinB
MVKDLTQTGTLLLGQLKDLIHQLADEEYSNPQDLLSGNTLAKHIRHVLEIYDELLQGVASGTVNYDARKRNLLLEHNREFTFQFIEELIEKLHAIAEDKTLKLEVCFNTEGKQTVVETTLGRELAYNIEHATHHMAILQIAVKHCFPHVKLEATFGVAYSTLAYLKHVHA